MKLNLNDRVKVKLTDAGAAVYEKWLSQFPVHARGYEREMTLALWELAQAFGPEMFMGDPRGPFFEGNEMDLEDDEPNFGILGGGSLGGKAREAFGGEMDR